MKDSREKEARKKYQNLSEKKRQKAKKGLRQIAKFYRRGKMIQYHRERKKNLFE